MGDLLWGSGNWDVGGADPSPQIQTEIDIMVLECREIRSYGGSVGVGERMSGFNECPDMRFLLCGSVLYKVVFLVFWGYIAVV